VVHDLAIYRVQRYPIGDLDTRNTGGTNEHHLVLVRVHPRERNLDRGCKLPVIELRNERWTGRIDAKLSRGKGIGIDRRGELFRIRDLKTSSEGIDPESAGRHIQEAHAIQDSSWDFESSGPSLDQRYGLLPKPRVPRNREHHRTSRLPRGQHSTRNRRIEIAKIASTLIEVVTVGHPRIAGEVFETGVDSGPQDDAVCCI
jgi:hypothetical protein